MRLLRPGRLEGDSWRIRELLTMLWRGSEESGTAVLSYTLTADMILKVNVEGNGEPTHSAGWNG